MNKRILKLFNEAGFHQPEMERLGIEDKFEKFAELIVKECADRIDDLVTCDDDGNQMLDCDDVRTELLEHFGVEE